MRIEIRKVLRSSGDLDWAEGLAWYPTARQWAVDTAAQFGKTPEIVVAMIAALSPRNRWAQNLRDVVTVLRAERVGDHHLAYGRCGTFNKNVDKAYALAATGDLSALNGRKVLSFMDNILNPDSLRVTVDVWAMRIALGDLDKLPPAITPELYNRAERAYTEVAEENDVRPCELQAITWVTARRLVSNRLAVGQLPLF